MEKNFIITKYEEVASQLKNSGYELVYSDTQSYVFANCGKLSFSNIDTTKVHYSNILCF